MLQYDACAFVYCAVRNRFNVSPKRGATSRSMNLFRGMFQVVNRIVTKSLRFFVWNIYSKVSGADL